MVFSSTCRTRIWGTKSNHFLQYHGQMHSIIQKN